MRHVTQEYGDPEDYGTLAKAATDAVGYSMDSQSGYGVGAALLVEFPPYIKNYAESLNKNVHIYAGANMNFSGMQTKVHAEQSALQQFLTDAEMYMGAEHCDIRSVVVKTSEDDNSLVCGHCLQVFNGACEQFDFNPMSIEYCSVSESEDGERWDWEKYNMDELLTDTYVSNR